jgi:hypothetical protein
MVEIAEGEIECINSDGKCPCASGTMTPTPTPHVFRNATIPAGNSVWTVPAASASPVSRFQVTVRNSLGSDILVRVLSLNTTQFSIDATVASSNSEIFVEPMQTFS